MYLELVKRYYFQNEPAADYEVLEFLKIKMMYSLQINNIIEFNAWSQLYKDILKEIEEGS